MKSFRGATDTFKELGLWFLGLILLCAGLFAFFEGKNFFDAVWWGFVTALSVGYGDMYPVTLWGRVVGVVLMCTSLLVVIPLIITRLVENMLDQKDKFTHEEQEKLASDVRKLRKLVKALMYAKVVPMQEDIKKIKARVHVE